MTPTTILASVQRGRLPGRHVIVCAHPDDETISCAALLSAVADATIVQVTTGAHDESSAARRRDERHAALAAARWPWPVVDLSYPTRAAHQHGSDLVARVARLLRGADAVWTHPYEAGHLDHDTAAWAVQCACVGMVRMEFASYHLTADRRQVFGAFFPCPAVESIAVRLSEDTRQRKRAAVAAYASQAHILRKFPDHAVEHYRAAPVYDFHRPAPPGASRWDVKGYAPSTAVWRQSIAACEREAA